MTENHSSTFDSLMTEHEVARVCGLSVASVRRWRLLRTGPRYLKIRSSVRYRPADVAEFLNSVPTGGGPEAGEVA